MDGHSDNYAWHCCDKLTPKSDKFLYKSHFFSTAINQIGKLKKVLLGFAVHLGVPKMPAWRFYQILFFSLSLLAAAVFSAKAHAEERFDLVSRLKHWQTETAVRQDLEAREKDQRLTFINRLIFQTERKYQGEAPKEFFVHTFSNMIETDQKGINQSLGGQEIFLSSLQDSLDSLLEPKEDPLHFIQAFMEFSGISDPATTDEFAETRSYFDGRNVLAAQSASLEEAALAVEEKEKGLDPIEKNWFDYRPNLLKEFNEEPSEASSHLQSLEI